MNSSLLEHWIDKHQMTLSDHYRMVVRRYCRMITRHEVPVGRPIALFMMWWNNKHRHGPKFSVSEINFYYYY